MNNAKRLKKRAIRSLLDSIARSLCRQAVAAERCRSVAHITQQNYDDRQRAADRLLAATRQACQSEAPDA